MDNLSSKESLNSLSRRALIRGVGGGALASLMGSSGVASALVNQITVPAKLDVGATLALQNYFGARVSFNSGGNFKNVLKYIDPGMRPLIEFESARYGALSSLGSVSRWNGSIDRVASAAQIISATQSGSNVTALVSDWTSVNWRPAPPLVPIERTPEEWALVRKNPERYGLNIPSWTPTESGFGTTHLVTLESVNGQWLVTKDAYDESVLLGDSPDYSPDLDRTLANWQSINPASASLRAKSAPALQSPGNFSNSATYIFDYNAATAYAIHWASSYNPAYQNYASTNSDCANFVSQSFIAGKYATDGVWSPYSYAWVNNVGLRNWLISSGRGHDETASMLGLADCVNYDWTGDGTLDHIALVTSIPGSVPLVSCHSAWQLNVPYNAIYGSGYMPSQVRKYTGTWLYYPV